VYTHSVTLYFFDIFITAQYYAERGIATASLSSAVRPSVCDVEVSWSQVGIHGNNFTVIGAFALCRPPNNTELFQREHPEILAGTGAE